MTTINAAFWIYSRIVKPVKFYREKVIELGKEIKPGRQIHL